ncbi:MAG: YkgJ family cysteine cluster protein [Candidatus Sedimenticola sp. (ex Thyasira tokunagai)]
MSDKFDLPHESQLAPQKLDLSTKIQFKCHKGISCFNACCKRADVTLTPYDVIRMKEHFGMSSGDFLKAHTVPFEMDQQGMPGIKMRTDDEGACLFVTDEGCSIYEDRPTACRYYPLGHMAIKEKDATEDAAAYFMISEEHCKGHEEDQVMTIAEFRKDQFIVDYDGYNRDWLDIQLKKRSSGPAVGNLPEATLQLFFMASYDMDRFRRFVMSDQFRATYDMKDSTYDILEKEDVALMQFGVRFMKQAFFGERTIEEMSNAWEERVENRQEVWDMRREAEIARKQAQDDEMYKSDD